MDEKELAALMRGQPLSGQRVRIGEESRDVVTRCIREDDLTARVLYEVVQTGGRYLCVPNMLRRATRTKAKITTDYANHPLDGSLWRHFKDADFEYRVMATAFCDRTGEPYVVYRRTTGGPLVWARKLSSFLGIVTMPKQVKVPRFSRVP